MIDLDQKATDEPADFWGIGLVNPNPFGVTVRISLLSSRSASATTRDRSSTSRRCEEDVDLASMSNHVIWLPEDVRGQFHEVSHHLRQVNYT